MIYLYGKGDQISMVVEASYLTAEQKAQATLVLDKLPEQPVPKEGFFFDRYIDEETNEFSWVEKKLPNVVDE